MQAIVPPALHNPNGYNETEILAALRGVTGSRKFSFRYELLNSANVFVQDLTNVLSCKIDLSWNADIKQKAQFDIIDTGEINFLSDRIKPYIRLHMPPIVTYVAAQIPVTIRTYGAQGGGSGGGTGGYVEGTFSIAAGTTLNIRAGGQGQAPLVQSGQTDPGVGYAGGFNGGGSGGYYYDNFGGAGTLRRGGSGGGASDVRWGGNALTDRKITAAGGGGAATNGETGGSGGGTSGSAGTNGPNVGVNGGGGGTSSVGGAGGANGSGTAGTSGTSGVGGNGGIWVTSGQNGGGPGGGGGGYYGGGGGAVGNGFSDGGGGGGGSGYVSPSATSTTNSSGVRSGNGLVEVVVAGVTTTFSYTGSAQTFAVPGGTTAVLTDGGWVEWPQGVYLLASPARTSDNSRTVTRQVEAYDAAQIFVDDTVTDRYTALVGANIISAVSTLLGSITKNVTLSSAVMPSSREWEPGTSKFEIISDLLKTANYDLLSFDPDGVAIVRPYQDPATRAEEYTYADNSESIMMPDVGQELDLYQVPNKWVLVVSDPDWPYVKSIYTNTNPASPTSTVSRQRTITKWVTDQYAADQTTLDAIAARMAFEDSQIYEDITFSTGLNPLHSGNDVYHITFSPLSINGKYSEQSWSMELERGSTMKHKARRIVSV